MPCYAPLTAYYSAERSRNGKRGITFTRSASFSGAPLRLPCGQCIGCRIDKVSQWATRCMHEKRMHKESSFVTLTYGDEYLPPDGTLVKRDLQLFMKRLRKARGDGIRFYGCGEYGGRFGRPHYHVLLFNVDFDDRKLFSRGKRPEDTLYTSESLSKLWTFGHHAVGEVTAESCRYVAGYMVDKITGDMAPDHYAGREPEFSVMSRRPGIGHGYYMKYGHEIYDHDCIIVDGKRVRPPRFYDERYKMVDSLLIAELKVKRRRNAIRKSRADNTPDRRRVREVVQLKKLALQRTGLL